MHVDLLASTRVKTNETPERNDEEAKGDDFSTGTTNQSSWFLKLEEDHSNQERSLPCFGEHPTRDTSNHAGRRRILLGLEGGQILRNETAVRVVSLRTLEDKTILRRYAH